MPVGTFECMYPTPPPCKNNTKIPKDDGNNAKCCSDKGGIFTKGKVRCGSDQPHMLLSLMFAPRTVHAGCRLFRLGWVGLSLIAGVKY